MCDPAETCSGTSADCPPDEGLRLHSYYRDFDEDGYGDPNDVLLDCRLPGGGIATEVHRLPWDPADHPWMRAPLVRGVMVLAESLAIGMRAILGTRSDAATSGKLS